MQPDLLEIPAFARVHDYAGLWLLDSTYKAHYLALAQGILANFDAHLKAAEERPMQAAMDKAPMHGGKSIAILRAQGLLMKPQSSMGGTSTIMLRRDIRQAAADPEIGGILLAIDSPGGTVAGMDDLAADVRMAKQMKPVWAHIEDLGASAAYWLASQANRVTVNSSTALVGSIGTIQVIQDMSAAAEKEGVKTMVFRTGPLKGIGTPGDKVTEEQAAHVQALVDNVQRSFAEAVRTGRNMTAQQVAAVSHGGVFVAQDALDAGLVDAIQPLSKTIADFTRASGPKAIHDTGRSVVGGFPMLTLGGLPTLKEKTHV
jgi:signal peptide peptidase SppA